MVVKSRSCLGIDLFVKPEPNGLRPLFYILLLLSSQRELCIGKIIVLCSLFNVYVPILYYTYS